MDLIIARCDIVFTSGGGYILVWLSVSGIHIELHLVALSLGIMY